MLDRMRQLLENSESSQEKLVGIELIIALITEFESHSTAFQGCAVDYYTKCHRDFEKSILPPIFQSLCSLLQAALPHIKVAPLDIMSLVDRITEALEGVLSWAFEELVSDDSLAIQLSLQQEASVQSGQPNLHWSETEAFLQPGSAWREVLINGDFLRLLCTVCSLEGWEPNLIGRIRAHVSSIFLQLAAVRGTIFGIDCPAPTIRQRQAHYAEHLWAAVKFAMAWCVRPAQGSYNNEQVQEGILNFARVVRKLTISLKADIILSIQCLPDILDHMIQLSCLCLKMGHGSECMLSAFNTLSGAWIALLDGSDGDGMMATPGDNRVLLRRSCVSLFNYFIDTNVCRLQEQPGTSTSTNTNWRLYGRLATAMPQIQLRFSKPA